MIRGIIDKEKWTLRNLIEINVAFLVGLTGTRLDWGGGHSGLVSVCVSVRACARAHRHPAL